jgi:hypothetical protein
VCAIRAEFYYLAEALASIGSSLPYFALEDRTICPQMSSCSWPPAQDYDNARRSINAMKQGLTLKRTLKTRKKIAHAKRRGAARQMAETSHRLFNERFT